MRAWKSGTPEGAPLLIQAFAVRLVAIAAVTAAPVVFPAHTRALAAAIVTLFRIGANSCARRPADDGADRGTFRTSGHRAADHRASPGADNRTTNGILGAGADRHSCKRSQSRSRKNCLAHV